MMMGGARLKGWLAAVMVIAAVPLVTYAQTTPAFVAPPRTIADITAILDQQKPDPARAAKLRADADGAVPSGGDLVDFYFRRAQARWNLGRSVESIADTKQAMEIGRKQGADLIRYQQFLLQEYANTGQAKEVVALATQIAAESDVPGRKGRMFNAYRWQVIGHTSLGEIGKAEAALGRLRSLMNTSRLWPSVEQFRISWEADLEDARARVLEVRGRYKDAEAAYDKSRMLGARVITLSASWPNPPPRFSLELNQDFLAIFAARVKGKQGRLIEMEADIRRALLNRLKISGKYNNLTPQFIFALTRAMIEQRRFKEAEELARAGVEIYRDIGMAEDSVQVVNGLTLLAGTLQVQARYAEAAKIYTAIDRAIKSWDRTRADNLRANPGLIYTLYNVNRVPEGIESATVMYQRAKSRFGENHFDTAIARGTLALGLYLAGRDAEALPHFKASIPILISASRENDDDNVGTVQREQRVRSIVQAYIGLLARAPTGVTPEIAAETFRIADVIRGQSVQRALTASSARAAASDPALAELVRNEQDLEKEISAQLGSLTNMLSLPPEERDDKAISALRSQIDKLQASRTAAQRDIQKRFPHYAELIEPKPPTAAEVQAALKPGEAFVSFYFGSNGGFVWVVPQQGPVAFAAVKPSFRTINDSVRKLRQALEPQAAMISDIPPFDVALAYQLYVELLKPVEGAWKNAKSLIVATNGALGLLPLSLLPTAPAELKADGGPPFANYRAVPWLARTHAVTMIPSASALRTLRHLPPGSDKRERMIGFGDPYFNAQQAAETIKPDAKTQVAEATMRGIPLGRRAAPQTQGVDSAELSQLPRLPDTAAELKSIAIAMQADPSKVLHLGKDANEREVKTTPLNKYRVVVFATHGLVPGELNGLTQPALALTAPDVADVDGDGLLTMEEILSLKLDADWVVLSACNTGSGAGAGAEAASGLGRAFFYAGTRALLVTNWSVHSESARELVTDLFRRQAADPKLTRGEALRQAMMALLDGKGFADAQGKMLFAYGHPLFWAPYTIIGDGGSQ